MSNLKNKTVVITGAGSGMGKAMVQLFVKEGANVVAADLREDRLKELAKEVSPIPGSLLPLKVNIADESDAKRMIEEAIKHYSSLDVLINNAGVLDDFMPVGETSTHLWNHVMGVNINGPFFSCREAVPVMLNQGKGIIINISSIGGFCGARAGAAYTTSKHALIGLTRNIGFQYAQKGIRCNAIAPGGVQTNIAENMKPSSLGYERLALGMQTNPRMGEASEVAEIALFLATDKSSFINGTVITADGGWTAY